MRSEGYGSWVCLCVCLSVFSFHNWAAFIYSIYIPIPPKRGTHITISQDVDDQGTGARDDVIGGLHATEDPGNVAQRRHLVGQRGLVGKQTHTRRRHCLQDLSLDKRGRRQASDGTDREKDPQNRLFWVYIQNCTEREGSTATTH